MPMHDWTRVDPNDFHDIHVGWIAAIRQVLNTGLLPPGFFAMAEHQAAPVVPDVLTMTLPGDPPDDPAGGGTAVLAAPAVAFTAQAVRRRHTRRPDRWVAIRHARNRKLVAVIEIVSPSNKRTRTEFAAFVGKSVALLRERIHLLVIDPFPPGRRDPRGIHDAIWRALARERYAPPAGKPLTLAAYRSGPKEYAAAVEPFAVGDALRDMPLFLAPGLHVWVPLDATYQTAWGGFAPALRPLLENPPG